MQRTWVVIHHLQPSKLCLCTDRGVAVEFDKHAVVGKRSRGDASDPRVEQHFTHSERSRELDQRGLVRCFAHVVDLFTGGSDVECIARLLVALGDEGRGCVVDELQHQRE